LLIDFVLKSEKNYPERSNGLGFLISRQHLPGRCCPSYVRFTTINKS